jgi:hypothetical protein
MVQQLERCIVTEMKFKSYLSLVTLPSSCLKIIRLIGLLSSARNTISDSTLARLPAACYFWRKGWRWSTERNIVQFAQITQQRIGNEITFNLKRETDRLACVQAAINVGRWALWVKSSRIVEIQLAPLCQIPSRLGETCSGPSSKSFRTNCDKKKKYYNYSHCWVEYYQNKKTHSWRTVLRRRKSFVSRCVSDRKGILIEIS